jgi:hypothetical protein
LCGVEREGEDEKLNREREREELCVLSVKENMIVSGFRAESSASRMRLGNVKNINHCKPFSKNVKDFWSNINHFRFDYYFTSHQT